MNDGYKFAGHQSYERNQYLQQQKQAQPGSGLIVCNFGVEGFAKRSGTLGTLISPLGQNLTSSPWLPRNPGALGVLRSYCGYKRAWDERPPEKVLEISTQMKRLGHFTFGGYLWWVGRGPLVQYAECWKRIYNEVPRRGPQGIEPNKRPRRWFRIWEGGYLRWVGRWLSIRDAHGVHGVRNRNLHLPAAFVVIEHNVSHPYMKSQST